MPATLNINKEIAKGSVWMLMMRFSVKGIGLVSTIILARLLMPDDFGLVALAMTVVAFIDLFQTVGVDMALIQNQKATKEHYNTAWTIKVILGILCGLAVAVLANFSPLLFDEPRLENILYFMSLSLFLFGLPNIGLVDFSKNMTFKYDFYYQVTTKFIGFFITIGAALVLRNYWALIIGQLSGSVIRIAASYYVHPFRPRFCLSKWRELLGFSGWIFLNSLLSFINNQMQYFFLGRYGKTEDAGYYKLGAEIGTITTAEIVAPINRAAYPGYSKLSDKLNELKASYLNVFSMIALIAIPSATGVALVAPELVNIILGDKWKIIIPVLQIIALGSIFNALSTNSTYIFFALSKQKLVTFVKLVKSLIFIALLFYLVPEHGIWGAAIAVLLSDLLTFPLWHVLVGRMLKMHFTEWLLAFYRPVISSALMVLVIYLMRQLLPSSLFEGIVGLLILCVSGALVFIAATLIFTIVSSANTLEKKLLDQVLTKMRTR